MINYASLRTTSLSSYNFFTKDRAENRVANYGGLIRSAVYGLWSGKTDIYTFMDSMFFTIRTGFTGAWHDGMDECGISPSEMTDEENDRLIQEIQTEFGFVAKFANDIAAATKADGKLLKIHTARVPLWVNRYINVRSIAKLYACGDQKLKWIVNPLKEHCSDCVMLDGRVYRASVWKTTGWEPRSRDLACRGYKCGCDLVPTNDPVTRGRPPRRF